MSKAPALKKKSKHGEFQPSPEAEEAVREVKAGLERTLASFMAGVGALCRTYDAKLREALPHNPKAHFFEDLDRAGSPPSSPLLKRPPRAEGSSMSPLALAASPGKGALPAGGDFPPAPLQLPPADNRDRLLAQLRILKIEARGLVNTFEQIHDWIALNVPTLGDESAGPGVEVMGVVISNVSDLTGVIKAVYGLEGKYLGDRVEIEAKLARHPECPSYDRAMAVNDSNAWDEVEKAWRSIIRACLLVHSLLAKNMKILMDPKRSKHRDHSSFM
uniref:Proteasome activator PA28 C-terminal domain-containing protein n=1 Tax=Neobodo designis TaxID=312471 RepID=A0A7S1MS54_NEODS